MQHKRHQQLFHFTLGNLVTLTLEWMGLLDLLVLGGNDGILFNSLQARFRCALRRLMATVLCISLLLERPTTRSGSTL